MTADAIPKPRLELNYEWTTTLRKRSFEFYSADLELWTFNPDFSLGLQADVVDEMYNTLFPKVGNRGKKAAYQAFTSALLSLAQAVTFGYSGQSHRFIHRRTTQRTGRLKRYKTCDFNTANFTKALDALVSYGFVTYIEGFKGENALHGLSSLWLPEAPFKDWLHEHGNSLKLARFHDSIECILLRNKDKDLIDYPDTPNTIAMRQRAEASNNLRCQYDWSYIPLDDDRQFVLDGKERTIPNAALQCRRIFKDDFKTGGRFYCNAQNLRKAERDTITVDGYATIELDYKSLHPRLLYNDEELEAPIDCYASDSRPRELTKLISLFSINCCSFYEAHGTLMREAKLSSEEATFHLKAYAEEHKPIAHNFFRSGWGRLQHLDSKLVDAVLVKATAKRIPVLPVHDSFIVSTEWGNWLKSVIEAAYRELMGFDAVIDWDDGPDMFEVLKDIHGGDADKAGEAMLSIQEQALSNLKQRRQSK